MIKNLIAVILQSYAPLLALLLCLRQRGNMYFLEIFYDNAKYNGTGKFSVDINKGFIPKWTLLRSGKKSTELLRLIALALTGNFFLNRLSDYAVKMVSASAPYIHLETLIARHRETEGRAIKFEFVGSGLRIHREGNIENLSKADIQHLSLDFQKSKISNSSDLGTHFLAAYGSKLISHKDTDDFDFNNIYMRLNRLTSLFDSKMPVTNPVEFFSSIQTSIIYKRLGASNTLKSLSDLENKWLNLNAHHRKHEKYSVDKRFKSFPPWKKRMLLPLIDICRHMLDAFPRVPRPLDMPGVLLFCNPSAYCSSKHFVSWLHFVDELFPNLQVILSLPEHLQKSFPDNLSKKRLKLPDYNLKAENKFSNLSSPFVLLVHIDGRLPNLALMKLSRHFKNQGQKVILTRKNEYPKNPEAVFASCIFNFDTSAKHVENLRKNFGDCLTVGGSGVDIQLRMEKDIEELEPDFDLYPELGDRAIGFLTRGCPNKCSFCIVPQKEGASRQVCDLESLLQGRKKLILLDDNILAHPEADTFLEQMVQQKIRVNFNQTLDIRLINKERAGLLKQIRCENVKFTRSNYHFSLNNDKNLDLIAEKYRMLEFTPRDNVEFICMYGFNTTLAKDVRRFKFLRSLPGAYVFTQRYRPVIGGPACRIENFFDDRADDLIDDLVNINFTQNMKTMEIYYKWVSRLYVETFGKLNMNLVDTIFKYNFRHRKGAYIASLAGTRKRSFV